MTCGLLAILGADCALAGKGDKLRSVRCAPEQLAPQRAVLDNCPFSAPSDTLAQNCHDQPTLSRPGAAQTGTRPAATTTCAYRNRTCHTPPLPVAAQPLQEQQYMHVSSIEQGTVWSEGRGGGGLNDLPAQVQSSDDQKPLLSGQ